MLAAIPALGLLVYSGLEQRQQQTTAAQQTALRIAQHVSHNQSQLFSGAQQLLIGLSQLPAIRQHDAATCNKRLADMLEQFRETYISFTAFKPNGDLFCSAPANEKIINIADRRHYKEAMSNRELSMSGYVISRLLGKPSVFLSQPALNQNGDVEALINVGMDLDWINKLSKDAELPNDSVLTVFDNNGITLARYPDTDAWLGKPIPEQMIISHLQQHNSEGTTKLEGPDGITRLYGFLPLGADETNAFVAVGLPLSVALASTNQTLFRNIVLLGLVTLFAIVAIWFGSAHFFTQQLNKLINVTRRLSDGNLDTRAQLSGGTKELTELGHAFNSMATSLQKKETERVHAKMALQASEEQLRHVMAVTDEGIWDWDIENDVVRHNMCWCELLGYGEEMTEHPVSTFADRLHDDDREFVMARIQACLEGNGHYHSEHRMHRVDNQVIWVLDRGDVIERDALGQPQRMVGCFADITERKLAEEKLRQTATALAAAHDGVFMFPPDTLRFFYVNKGAIQQTGFSEEELLNMTPLDIQAEHDEANFRAMLEPLLEDQVHTFEAVLRCKDGTNLPVEIVLQATDVSAGQHALVAVVRDVGEKKKTEKLIWTQANYDALTELPNRRLFNDRLDIEIKKAHRNSLPFALLFIDLDRFKDINDTLGHAKGDQLLLQAAHRISHCVRESDTVARLGGDEFTVVLTEIGDRGQIERIAENIIEQLSNPFYLEHDSNGYYISASIGIALYPHDGKDIESLLKHADQAMYQAKIEGRQRYSYFTESMQQDARQKLELTQELRLALTRGELSVYYQPIVELSSGNISKCEALLRWHQPNRGMVGPAIFVPLAEESGLIHEIGEWVFEESIKNIDKWRKKTGQIIQVSVNKSPVQFEYVIKKSCWSDTLDKHGLPGNSITVEITEGLLLKGSPKTKRRLLEFREKGIEVSIDDFGTGFSALSYLKQFDIDYLKIDRSFISNICENESDKILTEAIIVMAHKLGIQTIAEGVETVQQRDLILSFGCDYAQGFLYSPAVPADEFEKMLSASAR